MAAQCLHQKYEAQACPCSREQPCSSNSTTLICNVWPPSSRSEVGVAVIQLNNEVWGIWPLSDALQATIWQLLNWLSSSYTLTHQNEVVYVHTEPQNFILGHSSWSRQQIHLPASLTSAQLTDQPQMSSSSGAGQTGQPTTTKLRCPSTNRWLQTLLNIETLLSYWDL